jgi:MYXO-CTERM domain-containing protein
MHRDNMNRAASTLAKVLLGGVAALGFAAASAAPLAGNVSSAGTLCLGSSPSMPPPTACTNVDISTLTYLDFINGGLGGLTPTPGSPGNLLILTAAGDLLPLIGQTGSINDFAIPGPGDPLSSFVAVNPLWTAVGTDGMTYTYSLTSLDSVFRINHHALFIGGQGTMCRNGADCNLFTFLFTTQDADGALRTTFSLSQAGGSPGQQTSKVAEPGPLALLALGLIALAAAMRRRTQ